MFKIASLLFAATLLFGSCVHTQSKPVQHALAKPDLPNTAAAKRAVELLSLINIGVKNRIADYLAVNAAPTLQDNVDFFVMVHRDTLSLSIESVKDNSSEDSINLKIVSDITGLPMKFSVRVEKDAPNKIAHVELDFVDDDTNGSERISVDKATGELNAFFNRVCQADMFSGAVLLAKDGKIIFQNACGDANKDFSSRNTVGTKFNLGSMNKMFTAIAIAQLMEQGKLSFDDPLSKFMPNFPNRTAAEQIKIHHLLSHTSGLGNYFNDKYNATPKDKLKTIDDFLSLVKDQQPAFAPGAKWQYSNTGFLVLGKIIEIITNKSYFDYVDENIYAPTKMAASGSFDLTEVNPNLAVGYHKEHTDNGYRFTNNLFAHVVKGGPAGGGYSTVGDLFRFSMALQTAQLIKQETLAKLITPTSLNNRNALGFGIDSSARGMSFGHGGGFIGISSELSIFPDAGITVVVLSNYSMAATAVSIRLKQIVARLSYNKQHSHHRVN